MKLKRIFYIFLFISILSFYYYFMSFYAQNPHHFMVKEFSEDQTYNQNNLFYQTYKYDPNIGPYINCSYKELNKLDKTFVRIDGQKCSVNNIPTKEDGIYLQQSNPKLYTAMKYQWLFGLWLFVEILFLIKRIKSNKGLMKKLSKTKSLIKSKF